MELSNMSVKQELFTNSSSISGDANALTISDLTLFRIVMIPCYLSTALIGSVLNCLNTITFWKMGLGDSVSLTFFSLSLTDLGVTFFAIIDVLSLLCSVLKQELLLEFDFEPFILYPIAGNTKIGMTVGSILLTTFLAIQRCCCVALPFHFRGIFTKNRTGLVLAGISVVVGVYIAGMTCVYSGERRQVAGTNRTAIQLLVRPFRNTLISYLTIINNWCVTFGCQIIVIICVIVMAIGLRRSAEFRTRSAKILDETDDRHENGNANSNEESQKETSTSKERNKSKVSEIHLIKAVALVSMVFIVCNIPAMAVFVVRIAIPEFDTFGRYAILFLMLANVKAFFELLNSSFNFFIYWNLNTKYRETFRSLFATSVVRLVQSL